MSFIPKIQAKRSWDVRGLEAIIKKREYYSNRVPGHYERMMDFVGKSEPTYEALYQVALDIQLHTPVSESISNIMSLLEKNAVDTAFAVEQFNPFDFK